MQPFVVALHPGTRLGPYEIADQIGKGGMGEVYRALDTHLGRHVAVKILPDPFAHDPERLARFEREAKTLAALNHLNIAQIYGLERSDSTTALVMELVDGPTLADRIAQGALPFDEVLPIAKQMAEALEAAHEQGIIHRDLKPANIKVRPDGTVKVLDFGLAKALEPVVAGGIDATASPTITSPAMMTGVGIILGTAAYMSPEQAKGRPADKRSDVWAFGCVLFEMLTGKRAFEGDDVSDTLALVLRGTPDWAALPTTTSASLSRLLRGCLQKDRRARVPDIAMARFEIDEALATPADGGFSTAASQVMATQRPRSRRVVFIVAAAVVLGALGGGALVWALKPTATPSRPVTRFTFMLGEGQRLTANQNQSLAFSPDGSRFVYAANNQLYVKAMSERDARPISGTAVTGFGPLSPVFSPDGQSIAFYSEPDRVIKKIAVSGGAAVTVCSATLPLFGMTWDATGILFGQRGKGIQRVSATGGQPETLVSVKDGELAHGPQMLPGGDGLLFTSAKEVTTDRWNNAQIVVQSLKSSDRKTLLQGGSDGRYLPTGHLVYALGGVLFAVPFDLGRLAVTGEPVPVVEGVKRSGSGTTGIAHANISSTGSLVFVPGPTSTAAGQSDLAVIDRNNGTVHPLKLQPGPYEYPRLSPDGTRVAFGSDDGTEGLVWIYPLSGTSSMRRLSGIGRNRMPIWSADGEHVAFQSDRDGDLGVFWQRADGATPAERLTTADKDTAQVPETWSPDNHTLLISVAKGSSYTLAALTMTDRKLTPFGRVESALPPSATFSPNGKWVAYSVSSPSSVAGSLFAQPFPPTGVPYPISKGSGIHATWSSDGKELFYSAGPNQFVSASVSTEPAFTFGNPVRLMVPTIYLPGRGPGFQRNYDIMRDGKRFLAVVPAGQITTSGTLDSTQIEVVLNWTEELKRLVPDALRCRRRASARETS